jgi:hypothetical protein
LDGIKIITDQIRNADYGLEVRENIALGIEQISDKEDAFELRVTQGNNTFQQSIITRESAFEQNITNKENMFENTINNSENTRQNNENIRQNNENTRNISEIARTTAETNRIAAETNRIAAETTRTQSENLRVAEWATYKKQNTMMLDLYVRKAVLIPVNTILAISRASLTFNPLCGYSVTSLTSIDKDVFIDNGINKDNLCYYGRNQIRGSDSILFKTTNEYILNGAEVI